MPGTVTHTHTAHSAHLCPPHSATKSLEEAVRRCPHGMYSEIKYDGERVQIHKSGPTFNCFSRNLKPVLPHKVADIKAYLPKATDAQTIILDGEVLLMDTKTHRPLPFGTLNIHKKAGFKDATVCIFLFGTV